VVPQNLIIPGACFIQADGKPNVTRVFAVERSNPGNVIEAAHVAILNNNLIDALFDFTSANAGKVFLIYASGPNGTSRNLRIPAEAPEGCVLGNEQGVQVTFTCIPRQNRDEGDIPRDPLPAVFTCRLARSDSGGISLELNGLFVEGVSFSVNGVTPKKVKLKDSSAPGRYTKAILKGRVCNGLPGLITTTNPGQAPSLFQCATSCQDR
jgi:hypothetical protein